MRRQLWMGLIVLPALLIGCGGDLVSQSDSGDGTTTPPYQCRAGELDGPGVINGTKMTGQGRIGKGLVYIIQDGPAGTSTCTGTLIGADMVLTAAHCVDQGLEATRAERLLVIFGNDPFCNILVKRDKTQIAKAEKIAIHPSWTGAPSTTDLALIKLRTVAPGSALPITVATDYPSLYDGREVYAVGFGKTTDFHEDGGELPFLRFATLKPQNQAPNHGITNNPASRKIVLNQRGGQSLCRGDSGGPAMVVEQGTLKVFGVASHVVGAGGSSCKNLVVHTNIAYYRNWLKATYQKLSGPDSSTNPF